MKIRHNNAKAKENHLSIKDLPADLGKAKDELKSRIDSLGIDKNIVTKYQSQVDDLKNLKGDLKSLVERVNTDSDKLASGAHVISIKKGDEVEYLVQTEDEMLEQLEKVKETNEKIKQLNEEREQASKERKAEIDAEIANKEAERQESYKYASDLVNSTADAAVNFTKGVISGDPDRMVDVILGALAGIFSLLPKGIALGVTAVKSAWDKHKANEKLEDEDIKQLEQVQMDVVSEGAINSDPMTPEELEEVNNSFTESAFEDVGKITDWESAFKYGYAKLKQIHGVNFDEAKAKEVLEGLKAKYPDNPKVVIGALKYGGRRKKENVNKTEENNSRTLNSVPGEIYAVWEQMEEGQLLDVAYTGPFTSTEDAKSKLGFKYWTQEGGMKNRVTLVSKKYIPDFKFFVPVDEFIKDWNNALRGFSEVTSEIKTYLNMRKINSKFSTAIHKCGDGVRCSGVNKLSYLVDGFLDALSEDYSEEDVLSCLKGFMHHKHGNQGGMHRGNNSVHNFTGSPYLTDDEKSEVSETIEEFWDESKPLESYIKVLNYLIKNWGINVKDIPTNQFKTIEDLMDWESKNFGQVPSLIGNIENYIATELADYVDQLPSQYNSRQSNSISEESGDTDLVKMRSELNELADQINSLGVPGVSASFSQDKVDIHEVSKNGRDQSIGTIGIRKFDDGLSFSPEFYTGDEHSHEYGNDLMVHSYFSKDLKVALDFILSTRNTRISSELTREKLKGLAKEYGSSNKSDSNESGESPNESDSNKSLDVPDSVKSYVDTAYKRDGFKRCYGYYMNQVRAAKKKGNEKSAAAWQMKADYLMSINKNSRVRNSRGKLSDFRRKINSLVPNADILVADSYVGSANNDNYLDILSKIAKEIKEKFNVRKKFDTPSEFRAWAESDSSISDRMYVIIDYVLGAVTGMKSGVRKNNSATGLTKEEISYNAGPNGDFCYLSVRDGDSNLYHTYQLKKLGKNESRPECTDKLLEINKNIEEGTHNFILFFNIKNHPGSYITSKTKKVSYIDAKKEADEYLKSHPRCDKFVRMVAINSRSLNSDLNLLDVVSKSLPSDSTWNVEDNDGKITLSSGSRVLTIERTDDRYFLSDEKDVIYISSDLSKVIEEIKKLS